MKWFKGCVIAGLLCVALVGCGAESVSTTASVAQATKPSAATTTLSVIRETTSTTAADDPLGQTWGEEVTVDGLRITAEQPVEAVLSHAEELFLDDGRSVVYCMVTLTNDSSETISYSALQFTLYDSESFPYSMWLYFDSKPTLSGGDLLPGRTIKGAVAFDILTGNQPAYLDMTPLDLSAPIASWGE